MSGTVRKKKRKKKRRLRVCPVVTAVFVLIAVSLTAGVHRNGQNEELSKKAQAAQKMENSARASGGSDHSDGLGNGVDVTARDWNLILVNPWNALPQDFSVELADLPGGHKIDARCREELLAMLDDCRAAGLSPLICSSYRTMDYQISLYEEEVNRLHARGADWEEAYQTAATSIAYPGTSEHQTGLAVDLVDESYQMLDSAQEDTPVQRWLMKNSWRYGFILRYPTDRGELTGIKYEPWHYRYVGYEAAKEIYERNICLEEYLNEIS